MVLNRERIFELFQDKDISYVFNRVILDTTRDKARDTVVVRGSLLEEDLGLDNMEGLIIEMLIGDEFVPFYQNLLNLSYDSRSMEEKLYDFSVSLYKWISYRLGYVPDWILPNRDEYITHFINLLLVEADEFITDSEVLLGLLLMNTDFTKNPIFKEQLRLAVWSSTEKVSGGLDIAEDEYLQGGVYPTVDSLSLYLRLAERGYMDKDTLMRYTDSKGFRDSVVTDYEEVCVALNDFFWKYANGGRWVGFTDRFYSYVGSVPFTKVSIERVNPNQVVFRNKLEDVEVQFTFSDKVVVSVRRDTMLTIVYNDNYFTSTFEDILTRLERYTFRARTVIPIVKVLIEKMPLRIPTKEVQLKQYTQVECGEL